MASAAAAFTGIPLIENKGQWPTSVIASAEVEGGRWFLEKNGMTVHQMDLSLVSAAHGGKTPQAGTPRIRGHVYKVAFSGSSGAKWVRKYEPRQAYYNYFLGNDPAQWGSECQSFSKITLGEVYPNIDMLVSAEATFLKYDFHVRPGGDASRIVLNYSGQDDIKIENGRLKIRTSVGEVWEQQPIAWQIIRREKRYVKCSYVLHDNQVHYEFPEGYDKSHTLIIDPELVFSTYSGSFSDNFGFTATYDGEGYLYSGSSAFGQGYPTTVGAYQTVWGGGDGSFGLAGTDIAVSKYALDGTSMIWSTFLGGANDELPHSLICNADNELLMYGTTSSPNYPVSPGAYDTTFNGGTGFAPQGVGTDYVNGSDIVITRLNWAGSALVGSTFLGGSSNDGVNTATVLKFNYADEFRGEIDLRDDGAVVIASCTYSANFPIVSGFQNIIGGALDGCVVVMNDDLTSIIWSTFIGGTNDDSAYSAAFDSDDDVYVCGGTKSTNFPTTPQALSTSAPGGTADGWIARIAANGQSLLQSTYFGSASYDQLYFIETTSLDDVYVYGQSLATGNTWVINAAWSQPNSGMVVSKVNPLLNAIEWSTVFGSGDGEPNLSPAAFTVDICGQIYLSGWGGSTNTSSNAQTDDVFGMLVTPGAFQSTTNGSDFYLLVLEDDASGVEYASYYGGGISAEHVDGGTSRFDRAGVIYQSVCAGCGSNDDFPIFPANAHSPTNNSNNCNNGVFKFDFQLPITVANFTAPPLGCVNAPIPFTQTSTFAQSFLWNFGDGTTSQSANPVHVYDETGTYIVTLIVTHPGTCNETDTLSQSITIGESQNFELEDVQVCGDGQVSVGALIPGPGYTFQWIPEDYLSSGTIPNPIFTAGESTDYILLAAHGGCVDTLFQSVDVVQISLSASEDVVLCDGETATLLATFTPANAEITWTDQPGGGNVLNDNPSDADIEVSPDLPATYYVTAAIGSCTLEDEVSVNLVSAQTQILGDFTTCENDTVNLFVLDPNPLFTYEWTPANLVISGQNSSSVQVIVPADTEFTVSSATPEGCTSEDTALVTISELQSGTVSATATPSVIAQGQSSQLAALPDGFNYTWFTSNGTLQPNPGAQNPVVSPMETTTYFLTVFDGECTVNTSVTVRVVDFVCGPPSIYVPNTFTPNGDGVNDFVAVRANNVTEVEFKIFDRWGELVFETDRVDDGWDGVFRDRELDPDVYVYYLRAVCPGGEEYFEEGNITLIR
jgi:gliding motility-associated-like protein